MFYEFFIANRYLRSKRHTGFISLITYISAGGVMIGVAALVIVLSVMNGFETEVRDRIIGADAHLRLTRFHRGAFDDYEMIADSLVNLPHVIGISPYIQEKGMLRKERAIEGAIIKGVDPRTVSSVSDLQKTIVDGDMTFTASNAQSFLRRIRDLSGDDDDVVPKLGTGKPLPGIIPGKQLSFRLGVVVGDSVIVFSPAGMAGLMSTPRVMRFVVTGIFETGVYEYDDNFAYISLDDAKDLFEFGDAVTGIEIKLDDFDRAELVRQLIEDRLGYPYYPRTWHDMHRTLFRWMQIEKWIYTILLSLIILVAAFNIVSSQIMMALEKRREIGVLKAMGAPNSGVMRIFMIEGAIIGAVGTALGLVLGWAVCAAQMKYKFFSLPGDVYFLDSLPVRMQPLDFVIIAFVAMALTLMATVYPAVRASKLDPVEAIRYE